jgi:D-alanyl-D-alanine carboxypeptidase
MPDPRRISALAGVVLAALLFCPLPRASAQDATAYAVVDSPTGKVLLTRNATKKLAVGSLTNIATGMVVLDWLDVRKRGVGEMVTIPTETSGFPSNPIGFQPGDQVSIRDLLYAALMQSDDIAAYALAAHVGHDLPMTTAEETPVQAFVAQLNALARRLQMHDTLFVDATGMELNERRLPYSTALDMAQLARYAMNRSQFRFYVSQKARVITLNHPDMTAGGYELQNTNQLLGANGIDGLKTANTRRTGPCVVISAGRAPESVQVGEKYYITPRRLIVVVLGSQNRFGVAQNLLVTGWQVYAQWESAGRPL